MNIQVQACGLFVAFLLLFFYLSSKRLHLYREHIFLQALIITIINISLDILSVVAISYRNQMSISLVLFICRIYLVAVVWQNWSALSYVTMDSFSRKAHRKLQLVFGVISFIESCIIMFAPIYIFEEGTLVYTYGAAVMTLYVAASIDLTVVIVFTFIYRKRMNPMRAFATRVWMGIWVSAMLIQLFNNELLLVGFAAAAGMIVLYFALENPDLYIDKQNKCFNAEALRSCLNDLYDRKASFTLCEVCLGYRTRAKESYDREAEEVIRRLISYGIRTKSILVFVNENRDILFVSEDKEQQKKVLTELRDYFEVSKELFPGTFAFHVDEGNVYADTSELLSVLGYVRGKHTGEAITNLYIRVTEEDREQMQGSARIMEEIRNALLEDRVEVFFQPIYNVARKDFPSAEALVRIRKTDGSLMPPGIFIPIAEESGQILDLGRRVFEKCCRLLADHTAIGLGLEYLEINLSVVQSENECTPTDIIEAMEKYHINPSYINLEITETASITNQKMLTANMDFLRSKGIAFSLDDFGKGESNLMYLVDMNFDVLKLDMDMTRAFFVSDRARKVVKTVERMAHEMGMFVVAEGVETEEQLRAMMDIGIDYIQGYYFSKPLPEKEYLEFLRTHKS